MVRSSKITSQKRNTVKREQDTKVDPLTKQKKSRKSKPREKADEMDHSHVLEGKAKTIVHFDSYAFSAPINEVRKPIISQTGKTKQLLSEAAKDSFEKSVPFVIAYKNHDTLNVVFDLKGQANFLYRRQSQQEKLNFENGIWKQNFHDARFYVFFDEKTPAVSLGSYGDLEAKGISDEILLSTLLTPTEEPQKTQVLYLFLSEIDVFKKDFKKYGQVIGKILSDEEVRWQKEELLIDFAGSEATHLLRHLLDQKVNPNAFSPLYGVHAINVAQNRKKEENINLLLKYGADPEAKEQDPEC